LRYVTDDQDDDYRRGILRLLLAPHQPDAGNQATSKLFPVHQQKK